MGEDMSGIRAQFNGSLRVEARPERLTGEAGGMILREVAERLRLLKWLVERLDDPRNPAIDFFDCLLDPLSSSGRSPSDAVQ